MQAPKLTFIFSLVVFGPLVCRGGPVRKSRRDDRVSIINPNYTDVTNYPYTVSVEWKGVLMGGGVLVAERWVLTAAYNTDGLLAGHLKVRVGSNLATSGGKLYKVTSIVQHPSYSGKWVYDLSLLKLGAKVNTAYGTPVALATSSFQGNASGVITGFGNTTTASSLTDDSSLMQMATIELFDTATCNKKWYSDELSAGELCGYAAGVGPCYSDYGDPVVVCADSCSLVGVFAGSYGCADDHFPGIYTDIGFFYDWITNSTGLTTA